MALTRIHDNQLDSSLGGAITTATDPDLISIAAIDDKATGYLFKAGKNNWNVTPTILGAAVAPVVSSGTIIQSVYAAVPAATAATTIPLATAVPLNTAGTQIWSLSINPSLTTSKIKITGSFTFVSGTAARELVVAVFRGSSCIGVTVSTDSGASTFGVPVHINFIDMPVTTTTTTYSVRVGVSTAATWYVNKFATAYFSNMMANSIIEIIELA